MPELEDAVMEAYAANSSAVEKFETVELNHTTFEDPLRFVVGRDVDMTFPLTAGGTPVLFMASGFKVILPSKGPDGPGDLKLTLDNVSGGLRDPLNAAIQGDEPISLIYRVYFSSDLSKPGDIITGVQLWDVDLDVGNAVGTLRYQQLENTAFPKPTYDDQYYPALQEQ